MIGPVWRTDRSPERAQTTGQRCPELTRLWLIRIPGIRICGCFFRGHGRPQPGVRCYRWDWSLLSGVAALMSLEPMAI